MTNQALLNIAGQFCQSPTEIAPLGNGLINDTFLVTTARQRFVLQRINPQVFAKPWLILDNLQQLSRHLAVKADVKLQIPSLLAATDGNNYHRDAAGHYWRAQQWIAGSESREILSGDGEAEQVGFALAHFHRLCSDLPCERLHDTLPGFHIAPDYFQSYRQTVAQPLELSPEAAIVLQQCRQIIANFQSHIAVLENAKQQGRLQQRVIHGDPKLNNFLFRQNSDEIVSLIDLDTVKPGLVHYDIGDCLRSCCHLPDNEFDLDRCQLILRRYLQEAGYFFNAEDYDYLYAAILLLPLELGIRFLTDFLLGNRYFKVAYADENLQRAAAQLQLCVNIYQKRQTLNRLIQRFR